jgi:hypothetical protein
MIIINKQIVRKLYKIFVSRRIVKEYVRFQNEPVLFYTTVFIMIGQNMLIPFDR